MEKAVILLDSISSDNNQVINTKISLYLLLGDSKKGVTYLETIAEDRFYKPYQKEMYLNSILALNEKDSLKREILYKQAIDGIDHYLLKHSSDDQALADLFYTKLRFKPLDSVLSDIERYMKKDIYDKNFLQILKQSMQDSSTNVSVVRNF